MSSKKSLHVSYKITTLFAFSTEKPWTHFTDFVRAGLFDQVAEKVPDQVLVCGIGDL